MSDYNAVLGYMLPFKSCSTGNLGTSPSTWSDSDTTHTWPFIDYATSPEYRMLGEEGSVSAIKLDFATAINLPDTEPSNSLLLYISSSTGGISTSNVKYMISSSSATYGSTSIDDSYYCGSMDGENETTNPGSLVTVNWNPYQMTSLILTKDVYDEVDIGEIAVFYDISLPYNPELSSYTITPVIPSGGSQSYTAMNGRRQVVMYSDPVYEINAKFTWSDSRYTTALQYGLEQTLKNGTPLLFIEPYSGTDTTNRKAYLINLKELPTISMTSRNTYTVTITGTTQP